MRGACVVSRGLTTAIVAVAGATTGVDSRAIAIGAGGAGSETCVRTGGVRGEGSTSGAVSAITWMSRVRVMMTATTMPATRTASAPIHAARWRRSDGSL